MCVFVMVRLENILRHIDEANWSRVSMMPYKDYKHEIMANVLYFAVF